MSLKREKWVAQIVCTDIYIYILHLIVETYQLHVNQPQSQLVNYFKSPVFIELLSHQSLLYHQVSSFCENPLKSVFLLIIWDYGLYSSIMTYGSSFLSEKHKHSFPDRKFHLFFSVNWNHMTSILYLYKWQSWWVKWLLNELTETWIYHY